MGTVYDAVFLGAAFPHQHHEIAGLIESRDRRVPDTGAIIDALSRHTDKSVGAIRIGETPGVGRGYDHQEAGHIYRDEHL
jgi:hypothetical protein